MRAAERCNFSQPKFCIGQTKGLFPRCASGAPTVAAAMDPACSRDRGSSQKVEILKNQKSYNFTYVWSSVLLRILAKENQFVGKNIK